MPIINGRKVTNVPNSGVYGRDIINEMELPPGRRPVLHKQSGFETILRDKRYSKQELLDRKGNPLKVSDIPDRSKGFDRSDQPIRNPMILSDRHGTPLSLNDLPTRMKAGFGGRRDALSKQIISEQVFDLAENMFKDGVDFDEDGANWFVAPRFVLPLIWNRIARDTPLMICFPDEYPTLPPIGFYMKADIPQSPTGLNFYNNAYHEAWKEPLAHGWKWYCVYVQPGMWRPATVRRPGDWKRGDNLWTYMTLVKEALTAME